MKLKLLPLIIIFSAINIFAESSITLLRFENNKFGAILNSEIHENYGCKYPITYEFSVSNLDSAIAVTKSIMKNESGEYIPLRSRIENFNAVEALRIDMENNLIYLSIAFTEESDSVFIQFSENYEITFNQISKYYDNRKAVVTSTLDDVQEWKKDISLASGEIFQQYKIWLTWAFITDGLSQNTANLYQKIANNGFIEIASHSRTHPNPRPYGDILTSEISGNKQDLLDLFDMPELFRLKNKEYIYTWVAPNGYRDAKIDSLLAQEKYLVDRLYTNSYNSVANWDSYLGIFEPFGMSGEIGNTSWNSSAITDTIELANRFNIAYNAGNVYHVMFHPQSIDWSQRYGHQHLEYISERNDVWYVALGHLYLYELMANVDYQITEVDFSNTQIPNQMKLKQNYPNPFNPTTTIEYSLNKNSNIKLEVFNIKGQFVETLVNQNQNRGSYNIIWNARDYASGIYIYQLRFGNNVISKKMILTK